ncbi:MAG: hypothetical protein CMD35_08235 [Flavobacteriales bacterium]|nr:hypothetical protein [Flavobacteriales bacterium]|tara:strand:- start:26 stop:898 length:873 start_codon:yes stop_codon:yes gene_type:complete
MRFRFKILIIVLILCSGNPLRDYLNKRIKDNSFGSNFFKIEKSLTDSTEISFWGNSTSFMSFDAEVIQTKLKKSCFNYGLEGIYFDEIFHLYAFSKRHKNKHIVWVINPFEFLKNQKSKINSTDLFLPFSRQHQFDDILSTNEFKKIKYFGWNNIFKFNAEHWKFIFGGKNKVPFNEFGNVKFQKDFNNINEFYAPEKMIFSQKKITVLNDIIIKLKTNNKLTLVIPPNLSFQNFNSFIKEINCDNIFNYANFFTNSASFQDHIHINPNEMKILTYKFCKDFKRTLLRFP